MLLCVSGLADALAMPVPGGLARGFVVVVQLRRCGISVLRPTGRQPVRRLPARTMIRRSARRACSMRARARAGFRPPNLLRRLGLRRILRHDHGGCRRCCN